VAEKVLLLFYITGLALSFRYLVKQLSPGNLWLSILIFPFTYSFLFYMGFYNTCISFVFLFFAQGYWIKGKDDLNRKSICILVLLFTLTYYSNVLSFLFLGFSLGTFLIFDYFIKMKNTQSLKNLKDVLRKTLLLAMVSLPGLVLLYFFNESIQFSSNGSSIPVSDLWKWLFDGRAIIGYNYEQDKVYTEKILYLMILIVALNFYLRIKQSRKDSSASFIKVNDLFLFFTFVSVVLFFLIPDGANAGMMSTGYCLISYMFFIVWVASLSIPPVVSIIGALLILILHFNLHPIISKRSVL
jgi:hypothetical protein